MLKKHQPSELDLSMIKGLESKGAEIIAQIPKINQLDQALEIQDEDDIRERREKVQTSAKMTALCAGDNELLGCFWVERDFACIQAASHGKPAEIWAAKPPNFRHFCHEEPPGYTQNRIQHKNTPISYLQGKQMWVHLGQLGVPIMPN